MKWTSAALALLSAAGLALAVTQAAPAAIAAGANVCTTQNASACATSLSGSAGQNQQSKTSSSQGHASKHQAHRRKANSSHSRSHASASHHSGRATTHKAAASGTTRHGTASGGTAKQGTASGGVTPLNLPAYSPGPSNAPSSTQIDTSGLLLLGGKFAIVLVLLLICLRVLRAVMPRLQGNKGQKGALVLHDEAVGDKGRVMLLDLETRLVVVGATGTTINGLTTIDDPAEVAHLRQRYRPETRKAPLITINRGAEAQDSEIMANRRSLGRGQLARPDVERETANLAVLPDSLLAGRRQADTTLLLGSSNHEPAGPAQADEEAEMPSFATLLARNTLSALRLAPPPELPAARTKAAPALPAPTQEIALQETRENHDDGALDDALDALRTLRRRVEVQ